MQRLSPCHWWMVSLRPNFHQNYHMESKLCLHKTWMKKQRLSSVLMKGLFKTILPLILSYQIECLPGKWLKALSLGRMPQSSVSEENRSKLYLQEDLDNECAVPRFHQCHWGMTCSRPSSEEAYHIDSMSSVSWETWTNVQRLPCVSHECPLQDCLPSRPIILTWWALFPGGPDKHAQASLYQWWMTIFGINISDQLHKLCLPVNLNKHTDFIRFYLSIKNNWKYNWLKWF